MGAWGGHVPAEKFHTFCSAHSAAHISCSSDAFQKKKENGAFWRLSANFLLTHTHSASSVCPSNDANISSTWHSRNDVPPTPLAHFIPDLRESHGSPLAWLGGGGGPDPWTSWASYAPAFTTGRSRRVLGDHSPSLKQEDLFEPRVENDAFPGLQI